MNRGECNSQKESIRSKVRILETKAAWLSGSVAHVRGRSNATQKAFSEHLLRAGHMAWNFLYTQFVS